MRFMKVKTSILGFGTLCLLSSWSPFQLYQQEEAHTSKTDLSKEAIKAYQMQSASDFLNELAPGIDLNTDIGKKRLELLVQEYSNRESSEELTLLYHYFPWAFHNQEQASLVLAKVFLEKKQSSGYQTIRNKWKGREQKTEDWFFLDGEAYSAAGHCDETAAHLASRTLQGEAETNRLVRLALLFIVENPELAWSYLKEASVKDPDNASLNTFKAGLLESAGKFQGAASEYVMAIQKDPENPYLREDLTDFYLRQHQYTPAIQILKDSLDTPSLDTIWVKALLLDRVVAPFKTFSHNVTIPTGELAPLVNYLLRLPPGIFWNETAFNQLEQGDHYLVDREETFWLRLLMALKNNQEAKALELLEQNPFQANSWMPDLEGHLKTTLIYRQANSLRELPSALFPASELHHQDPASLLRTLKGISKLSVSQMTAVDIQASSKELILSQEIFAVLFLAAGWDEAGLQLHSLANIPASFPNWVALQLTEALKQNRGPVQALQFAKQQTATPRLSLLISELALTTKQQDLAIEQLKTLYKRTDETGESAAKLLSAIYLEQRDLKAAKEVILTQTTVANEVNSKEILARIALETGDLIAANSLYLAIESESSEAKSFLARQAFADKKWERAKALTEELIKLHPDHAELKDNLQTIILEEQKETINQRRV